MIDAVLLSSTLSRAEKLRLAARPPVSAAVAARAAFLQLKKLYPHLPQDTLEYLVMKYASTGMRKKRRLPLDVYILEKAREEIESGSVEVEGFPGRDVVSPLTLIEYLTSPVLLRRLLPPEASVPVAPADAGREKVEAAWEKMLSGEAAPCDVAELLWRTHSASAFSPADREKLLAAAERLAAALSAPVSAEAAAARRAAREAAAAAASVPAAAVRILKTAVGNAVATRMSAADTGKRGQKTQGWSGWATGYWEYSGECDPLADPALEIARAAAETAALSLRRLRFLTSWLRRDRRIDSVYLPGPSPSPSRLPVLYVGVDASGSITRYEAEAFVKTVYDKLVAPRLVDPDKSLLIYWSTRVEAVKSLKDAAREIEERRFRIPSGGGTDPSAFLEYLEKLRAEGVLRRGKYAVMLLTDGVFGVDAALEKGFREYAKDAASAVAVITTDRETARKLEQTGWKVFFESPNCS